MNLSKYISLLRSKLIMLLMVIALAALVGTFLLLNGILNEHALDYIGQDKAAFEFKRNLTFVLGISAIVILFLVIASFVLHNRHVQIIIRRIENGINEMQKGNFKKRIEVGSYFDDNHQLGRLAISLNELAQKYDIMQSRLKSQFRSELEKADRLASVGELAASMAHEIKNPVAGISNAIQVISSELDLSDENRHVFDEILTQTQRVNRAINNLLTYARPSPPELKKGNINSLIHSTNILLEGQMREGNVKLELNLDPDLPNFSFDCQQIQQVYVNISLNAIQAMPEGGKLGVETRHENGSVQISVSDTGAGIPDDILPGIFIPFFTTKHKGTGLGLAICQSIVQSHLGEIFVETTEDKGSVFEIRLPINTGYRLEKYGND